MTLALPMTLYRAREVVGPALQQAIDTLDAESRALARYHFGWIDERGEPTTVGAGKAVRPALALLSAAAVSASEETAVPGAVAVELVHNFSLLHDDLMDGDIERRHRMTVWALHGAPAAILCGDALLALAPQVLLDVGTVEAVVAARRIGIATQELIRGQHADVAFERRADVTVDECLRMAAAKTGALLACASAVGAVLAGARPAEVNALATFGMELGLAFQLVDDLLGIWGDPSVTGKPVGSDLRARKKSLPVTYATTHGGASGRALARWLATEGPDADDGIAWASGLVESAGGRDWAIEEARRRRGLGEEALADANLVPAVRDELIALGRFIVTREG
jgi:geranylgeranyl diphosphate synthase type I